MNVEGAALMRLNRFAEAEPLLVGSQEGLKTAPIPISPTAVDCD